MNFRRKHSGHKNRRAPFDRYRSSLLHYYPLHLRFEGMIQSVLKEER